MGKHSERRPPLRLPNRGGRGAPDGAPDGPGARVPAPAGTAPVGVEDRADGAVVEVRGVGVTYGDVTALRGVSLSARPGQFVAVTGHSGAGKTTLINAIAGIVPLAAGEVDLGEGPSAKRDPRAVAIIPQGNGLASVLTAYENVLAPLRARGHSPEDAAQRATAALAAVGLGESGTHLIEELSGGQQQRAAVARGLAIGATVLLADEPTSELDHDNRERVLDLMRAQADAGAIVIMATHDPEAAARADSVIELDDGEVVGA
ncbi:ABC transporter ATP-binding protein [Knoellia locipacati]|uniref:Macrolide ABC transporter ATP-binding protein n=1 Tax=Knoellia locipacati TaxID=882824 RepID=A0A512T523_9MICO|nr:ATP-binding cassette domain-containing protein [Knoellia locipacati]GEQ15327.1 macrolide ABC transporter ATP-binding protein [Knoellia locipacati]